MAARKRVRKNTGQQMVLRRIQESQRTGKPALSLAAMEVSKIPKEIGSLKHLKILDLAGNHLTHLPVEMKNLQELHRLDLSYNSFEELPEWTGDLRALRTLFLTFNKLTSLPLSITRLKQLDSLTLSGNPIIPIPPWLAELRTLESLFLDGMQLTDVPEWIGELTGLRSLGLSDNFINHLPEWMGNLRELQWLNLERNQLRFLPETLRGLKKLRALFLHQNPPLGIPREILGPTWRESTPPVAPVDILEYHFKAAAAHPLNEAKLILLGRGGVGKTSLVERLIFDRFGPQPVTPGIHITDWSIVLHNGDNVRLHVWDFGGQEIMHATHQFFLTERSVYLVVVSGREGRADEDAEYWLRLIETFGAESPAIVVLNKINFHGFDLNRRGLHEKFPGRIREFIESDCKDRTGIDEVKHAIIRETERLPSVRDKFPARWFAIKDRLATMPQPYISRTEYRAICRQLGEPDEQAQDRLTSALHHLGIALNYRTERSLRDTHVLKPGWVTEGIYSILTSPLVEENHGEIQVTELSSILDEKTYPPIMQDYLLELMRKFELCFRFPEPRDHTYLIPQLLGKEEPDAVSEFDLDACLNFQFTYPIWPEGLIPRFIVRTHAQSIGQPRWRTGVILAFEGNKALVKGDDREKKVVISVAGPLEGRRRLLAIIRSDFERIHEALEGLKAIASVPIPGTASVAIPYEHLQTFERDGVRSIPIVINGQAKQFEVARLLNSVELPQESVTGDPVRAFISYSHRDEEFRAQLDAQLKIFERHKLIRTWTDRRILASSQWKGEIDNGLERADLVLLLVSPDFLASDYAYDLEMKRALERSRSGSAHVVPIILRPCQWQIAEFAHLQSLPTNGIPISEWPHRDAAWNDVADAIKKLIQELQLRATAHQRFLPS
jgi:internalin A